MTTSPVKVALCQCNIGPMVERGENAASEEKREIGRARTKHFPEYSPPRRFKPLKPGLLPLNSNCKTVNIHTIYCFAQFLTISIKRQNPKQVEAGRIMFMGSSISLRGRIAGSYPVQRLVIEPCVSVWNVFWILRRVLESGHCFWILKNVLSLRATVLSSSLFFPAFCCCCCCFR